MEFEIKGSQGMLSEFRIHLQNGLEKRGFERGPKLLSMASGTIVDFLREDLVVGIQILPEEEQQVSTLRMETEQDVPELTEVWDSALVSYGKQVVELLNAAAINKKAVSSQLL